jgi:hypothetical protein
VDVILHTAVSQSAGVLAQVLLQLGRELLALRRARALREVGCNSLAHYVVRMLGMPAREGKALAHVAEKLERLPALRQALEEGQLSWYAVQLLVDYATPESDQACVRLAGEYTVDQLKAVLRELAPELDPRRQKEVLVRWMLDTQTLVLFEKALRKLSEQHNRRLSVNEGLKRMSALVLTGQSSEQALQQASVDVELDLIAESQKQVVTVPGSGAGEPGAGEIRLQPVAELPAWQNRRLRFNPRTRALTPAQRKELMRRDGYRCATPGCQNTLWLQVHHVFYWNRGGETVPHNLVLLCSACHRLIHEGFLQLRGIAPHGLEFLDRLGRPLRVFLTYEACDWLALYYQEVDSRPPSYALIPRGP